MSVSLRIAVLVWVPAALMAGAIGCGGSKVRLVTVSGKVSFDGKPLEAGTLSFVTASTKPVRAYAAEVKGGAYSVQAEPGEMVVHIQAMREVPGKFVVGADGTKTPEQANYIPAKFNTASELKYKVPDNGTSDANFDIKP